MGFTPPFKVGEVVSNAVITETFKVGNMGGMRRSNRNGTLVLVSDNTKHLYNDKWHDKFLQYTGMGKIGDQIITGNQNKTLAESRTNGIEVHLFEVNDPGKYAYSGVVELAGDPYQEDQPDENGNMRKVWMFQLKKANPTQAVVTDVPKTVESAQETEPEAEATFDPSSVRTSDTVIHNKYGEGVITIITEEKIYVDFNRSLRIFNYPDAFEKGFLKLQ